MKLIGLDWLSIGSELLLHTLRTKQNARRGALTTSSRRSREIIITLKSTTPAQFGLTVESTGGPMCMTVAGKDFYAGLSVEALKCHGDAANPQNDDWLILKS